MVANRWTLEDADSHLNEVLDRVKDDGPQEVDRQGETFVIVTAEAWQQDETDRRSSLGTLGSAVDRVRQESEPERQSEWNDQEFRSPFAWVEEMSEEEVDAWEQRLNDARKRRIEAANSDER